MRYLFIDRVHRLEFNKQVIAIKNVALSEDVFSDHFFGFPVMPGALLIETLAQAGTVLLEVSGEFKKKALLVIVEQAKFRKLVHPGDQLNITLDIISFDGNSAKTESTIHVEGALVMSAKLIFSLKDADEFYAPESRHLIKSVYNFILKDAELIGFNK